jgi:small subunit ribosomal protein S20
MANIPSQEKRILRAARERAENRRYTSAVKTYFRRLETAVAGGDEEQVAAEHRRLVQLIDKAVKRGALHRNTGARKKARGRVALFRRGPDGGRSRYAVTARRTAARPPGVVSASS